MGQNGFSQKDLRDLAAIRDKLPQGDARVAKINSLLDANGYSGKYGDFSAMMAMTPPGLQHPAVPTGLQPGFADAVANTVSDIGNTANNLLVGGLKSAGHTAKTLLNMATPLEPVLPNYPRIVTGAPPTQPNLTNTPQKIGAGLEQAGEFAIPGLGEESSVAKAAPYLDKLPLISEQFGKRLARYGYQGMTTGAVNTLHGGDFTKAALLGAAVPAAVDAFTGAGRSILGAGLNRLMYPNNKDIGLFKNPARGIFDEGIVARNIKSLGEKAQAAKQATWDYIENRLASSPARLNTQSSIDMANQMADAATRAGNVDRAASLDSMRDVLNNDTFREVDPVTNEPVYTAYNRQIMGRTFNPPGVPYNVTDSPLSLELRNQTLADMGTPGFSTRPFDNGTSLLQRQIWANNRQMITDAVPGVNDALSHYADLRSAANAASQRASFLEGGRGDLSPVTKRILFSGLGATIGARAGSAEFHDAKGTLLGAALGAAAPALINNTPFYTGGYQALQLLNPFLQATKAGALAYSTQPNQ